MLRLNRDRHSVLGREKRTNDHLSCVGNFDQIVEDPSDDFLSADLDVAKRLKICFQRFALQTGFVRKAVNSYRRRVRLSGERAE